MTGQERVAYPESRERILKSRRLARVEDVTLARIVEPHRLADLGNGGQPAVRRRGRPVYDRVRGDALTADCYPAREGLISGDLPTAAAALRRLVTLASDSWAHASEQGQALLAESIVAFGVHASRLRRGEPLETAGFDTCVAVLHNALAWHHYELACQAASRQKPTGIARAVEAATHHVRSAIVWADGQLTDEAAGAVAGAWAMGHDVAPGAQLAASEVPARLAELRKAIREVAANITGRAGSHDPRRQSLLDFHQ